MAETERANKEPDVTVLSIGEVVTPQDIDSYRAFQEIEDRSYIIRTITSSWERQQKEERNLRRRYACWLLAGVFVQVVLANVAFFLVGTGNLEVEEWLTGTFIVGTFGEVVGLAMIVTKYLFPEFKFEPLSLLERL